MDAMQTFLNQECKCGHAMGSHGSKKPVPCGIAGCGCEAFRALRLKQMTIQAMIEACTQPSL